MADEELNDRERLFVEHYCLCWSATKAAKEAGYSDASAHSYGPHLLQTPRIRAAIDARLEELLRVAGIEQLRVLQELAAIAFLDPREAMAWGKGLILEDSDRIPDHVARAVAEVGEATDKFGNTLMKLKFHSKPKALELLGRYLGMFANRLELAPGAPGKGAPGNGSMTLELRWADDPPTEEP